MSKKKPTIKEMEAKIEMLNRVNTSIVEMVTNLGEYFREYIEFKDDVEDFIAFKKEKQEIAKKIMGEKNET